MKRHSILSIGIYYLKHWNNGNRSSWFTLQRGTKQSCPLPAYLLIIFLETFANKFRNDKDVKDIRINNIIIKISLLADDITLILADINSDKHFLNTLTSCRNSHFVLA